MWSTETNRLHLESNPDVGVACQHSTHLATLLHHYIKSYLNFICSFHRQAEHQCLYPERSAPTGPVFKDYGRICSLRGTCT